MKTSSDLGRLKRVRHPVVLAAGFFDGVHLGHRKVIERTIRRAREIGGQAWVLTFDTHPLSVLDPRNAPPLLTTNRHKTILMRRLGADGCLMLPFRRELAREEPDEFVGALFAGSPTLREILVGRNWKFGHGGRGDPHLLAELGREAGVAVTVVRPVQREGELVSSTRIRSEVVEGRLQAAAAMLGRPFSVLETVMHGETRGRRLGFPTANLASRNEVLPPHGVYAVHARVGREILDGVLNLGLRPTFTKGRPARPLLELHVFGGHLSLYGREVEVFFIDRLREERRFSGEEALRAQIARDADHARAVLDRKKVKHSLYSHCGGVI